MTKINENINLLIGDIITEVNLDKVTTVESFVAFIDKLRKTERSSTLLKVLRGKKIEWVTLKIKN